MSRCSPQSDLMRPALAQAVKETAMRRRKTQNDGEEELAHPERKRDGRRCNAGRSRSIPNITPSKIFTSCGVCKSCKAAQRGICGTCKVTSRGSARRGRAGADIITYFCRWSP